MNRINIPQARDGISKIKAHMLVPTVKPGNSDSINIASNESAYGPGSLALAAARQAMVSIERYAETAQQELAGAIADRFDLRFEGIVCGHGSDDLLARIARAYLSPGDELIYSCNGYQKIPNYAHANDAVAIPASDNNFTADVDAILSCLTARTRVVMIANPDNPTGTWLTGTEVRRLHAGLPSHVLLVLDSAYLEYVDSDAYENPRILVEENVNVVMTRTFSKLFGLAGARLGWAYAPTEIADVLRRIGITFPLSTPALAAGLATLRDFDHTRFVFQENRKVKRQFENSLLDLGVKCYPSQTNFLLAAFEDTAPAAADVCRYLADNGVKARRFPSPVFKDCIRFTIGLEAEMRCTSELLAKLFHRRSL